MGDVFIHKKTRRIRYMGVMGALIPDGIGNQYLKNYV